VQITLDEHGKLLAASDHVMFVRETTPEGEATITDHESIGGRFEHDGSFSRHALELAFREPRPE